MHATALVLFLVNNVCVHEIGITVIEMNVTLTCSKIYMQ